MSKPIKQRHCLITRDKQIQFVSDVTLRWVNIYRHFEDVLSLTGSSTARTEDMECLILMEAMRYFETSGNVYRPTSKGKGTVHPITGHEGPEGE
jgi:hypothetical protein